MPTKHIPHQTHIVVWGLPSCGKDFLTKLLEQRFPDAFSFGMGAEFRSIPTEGVSPFEENVNHFVRERMPQGDLAPLDVYMPVLDAAWNRQREKIRSSKLCVYNGVVRTMQQWYYFRAKLAEDGAPTHRVIVLCIDRPKQLCTEIWQESLGAQDRGARAHDSGGLDVFQRRLRIAEDEWRPLQEHLQNGSTADHIQVVVPGRRMENGFDQMVSALDLGTARPSLALPPRHDFLTDTHPQVRHPGRLRTVLELAA